MPRIIVQANQSDGDAGRVTLSERVVATQLQHDHYAAQLIERLAWAAIDAERLQSPSDGEQADEHSGSRPARPPGDTISTRPHTPPGGRHAPSVDMTTKRPIAIRPALALLSGPDATDPARAAEREHERAAAVWLYAWSYDALRPTGELLAASVTTPAVLRPGRRVVRISPRSRPRQTSP